MSGSFAKSSSNTMAPDRLHRTSGPRRRPAPSRGAGASPLRLAVTSMSRIIVGVSTPNVCHHDIGFARKDSRVVGAGICPGSALSRCGAPHRLSPSRRGSATHRTRSPPGQPSPPTERRSVQCRRGALQDSRVVPLRLAGHGDEDRSALRSSWTSHLEQSPPAEPRARSAD